MSIKYEEKLKKISYKSPFGTHARLRIKLEPILNIVPQKKFVIVKNSNNPFDNLRELMNGF